MSRLSLESRRGLRTKLQLIASHGANSATESVHTHIESLLDEIDYMEPPRWQRALSRRASMHAEGSDR